METLTTQEIRERIAKRYNCSCDKVRCIRCANWSYNNGGVVTSVGSSKCRLQKHKTDSYQFCRGFIPANGK